MKPILSCDVKDGVINLRGPDCHQLQEIDEAEERFQDQGCLVYVFFDSSNDILNQNDNFMDNVEIDCKYYDEGKLIDWFSSSNHPIALSANIQSLSSKIINFQNMLFDLENEKVIFDIIAYKLAFLRGSCFQIQVVFSGLLLLGFTFEKVLSLKLLMSFSFQ